MRKTTNYTKMVIEEVSVYKLLQRKMTSEIQFLQGLALVLPECTTTHRYSFTDCHIWFSLFYFFKANEKLEPQCADLLHLDWPFHCLEEPNNHCCSHTGLCDEGLQGEGGGGGRGEAFILNLTKSESNASGQTREGEVVFFSSSHHSSSCRWRSSDLLQCSRGERGWT